MAIKQLVAQAMAITKVRLTIFCTCDFDFYCVPAHDSRHFLLSAPLTLLISLSTQAEILIFLANQVSCDEYCRVGHINPVVH